MLYSRQDEINKKMKRKSLQAAINNAASVGSTIEEADNQITKTDSEKIDSKQPPSRQGKKMIGGHFDPVVAKQLKRIAVEHDKTIQELVAEGINHVFEKYGEKPLA